MLGVFSPFRFGLKEYLGYPIDKFKDHFRTLEVLVNRDGELGGIVALFFDGALEWAELLNLRTQQAWDKSMPISSNLIKSLLTHWQIHYDIAGYMKITTFAI